MSDNNVQQTNSSENKPISMWGYFGYEILFSIPIIGFILLIIFSFVPRNKNVKNFARSYFCMFILVLIIVIALIVTVTVSAATGSLDLTFITDIIDSL